MATAAHRTPNENAEQGTTANWTCSICDHPAPPKLIGINRWHIGRADAGEIPVARWKAFHPSCAPDNVHKSHVVFGINQVLTIERIDRFTARIATTGAAKWMHLTDWAEFTARAERQQVAA